MHAFVAVGGPQLGLGPEGWDAWPIVGAGLVLWIGRRFLQVRWSPALLVASIVGALALGPVVHTWGVVVTAGVTFALAVGLRTTRGPGSAKRNPTV